MGKMKNEKRGDRKGLDEELLNNTSEVKVKKKAPKYKQRMRKDDDDLVSFLLVIFFDEVFNLCVVESFIS